LWAYAVSISDVNYPTPGQYYGKDVPVHAIKTYNRSGNRAPIILILGGGGKQMSGQIYCPVASLPRDEPPVPSDWETVDS
jgi:hypothetical protein